MSIQASVIIAALVIAAMAGAMGFVFVAMKVKDGRSTPAPHPAPVPVTVPKVQPVLVASVPTNTVLVHKPVTRTRREWRRKMFPPCPVCGEGGRHAGHRTCPADSKGKLWIDILTGWVQCAACHHGWSIENGVHYCSCGAEFKGGELWAGMETEIGHVGNLAWVRRIGMSKGSLQPQFLGWWKQPVR